MEIVRETNLHRTNGQTFALSSWQRKKTDRWIMWHKELLPSSPHTCLSRGTFIQTKPWVQKVQKRVDTIITLLTHLPKGSDNLSMSGLNPIDSKSSLSFEKFQTLIKCLFILWPWPTFFGEQQSLIKIIISEWVTAKLRDLIITTANFISNLCPGWSPGSDFRKSSEKSSSLEI